LRNVEYCCRREGERERWRCAEDDEGDDAGDKTNKMLRCQRGFTSLPNTNLLVKPKGQRGAGEECGAKNGRERSM